METLIVEDFMLLLLDDDSGSPAGAGTLHYSLGGALLLELALAGRVEIESRGVRAVPGPPLDDPLLDEAFTQVAAKTRGAHSLLFVLGSGLSDKVTERLLERGLVRRETKKFLGLFRTTTWPADDIRHESELRATLERVLAHGERPDPRTAAIIALLSSIQVLNIVIKIDGVKAGAIAKRAHEIAKGNGGLDPVANAVLSTYNAIVAAPGAAAAVSTAT